MTSSGRSTEVLDGGLGSRPDGAQRWYVAESVPGKEQLAIDNLKQQAFHSLCPRFRTLRRHARRIDTVLAPLFPGYVFVRFDKVADAWRSINGTRGVKQLICSDRGTPQAMPERTMTELLSRCDDGIVVPLRDDVRAGQTVRVVAGPFADRFARIETMDARGRVRVLLDMLGGTVPLRLGLDSLAPV